MPAGIEPAIRANQKIYDEYFDKEYVQRLARHVLEPLDRLYFRSELVGFEELPERNNPRHPLIYVSNHSGMAFPWDAIIFSTKFFVRSNHDFKQCVRALAAPALSQTCLMNPFLIDDFWKRCGGIDATFFNFETMMHYQGSNILIYPEGVPGIGKGFDKRYQLQRFSSSFVRMSLKFRTDVIPIYSVNGEFINPYNLRSEFLNNLASKMGIPFIPVGIMTLLIPFQPWLFYFAFPAKLTYVMGKRLKPYEMIDKPYEEMSDAEIRALTDTIKAHMQSELDEAVARHGQSPYRGGELLQMWRKNLKRFPFFVPCFWPSIFLEFDHQARQGRYDRIKINFFYGIKVFLSHPIALAFFLPLIGWIPILLRGLRERKQK